jgi:hypothetical protein
MKDSKQSNEIIPSSIHVGASRHSTCRCSRPARCSAERKQCRCSLPRGSDPITNRKKRKQRSDHEQEEEEAASSCAGGTPQKRDRRSSPEQANSESDKHLGGSYSPKVLRAQAMGREYLCTACCLYFPKDDQTGPYIGILG